MTQVQHFVSRIKKRQRWDVQTMWAYDLWPRLLVIRVLVLCQSIKYKFRSYGPYMSDIPCLTYLVSCDLDLCLGGHSACGWCESSSSIRIQSLKFIGFAILKIRRTTCVSMGPVHDPDLWPFDLETGMPVASEVGNLPSKFGHARPLGSRIIRYVRDGRTDRQTDGRKDGQKQRLLSVPYERDIITSNQ